MNVEGPTRRSMGIEQFGIDNDSNRIIPHNLSISNEGISSHTFNAANKKNQSTSSGIHTYTYLSFHY